MTKSTKFIIAAIFLLLLTGGSTLMSHQNKVDYPKDALTVFTYNIDNIKDPEKWVAVAEVLDSSRPHDIILLQEVHGEDTVSFLAKNLEMPHFRYADYSVNKNRSGLAILSRYPLENLKVHHFSVSRTGYGVLAAEVRIKDQTLLVCCLHLDRIPELRRKVQVSGFTALRLLKKEIFNDTVRSHSVDELLDWLSGFSADRIIVGGDFNTFPLSKTIRKMNQNFNDALWPTTGYFTGTYCEFGYPFKPRIDFLFHSPAIKRYRSDVIKNGPSDHYPVKAIFELEG